MLGLFRFRRGPDNLGVGVANLGYERTRTLPVYNKRNSAHNVKRSLAPLSPAMMKANRSVPATTLLGSTGGSAIEGQFALMGLVEKQKG